MTIIFLDTETTNLLAVEAADLKNQPYIVEIYLLITDMNLEPLDEYHTLVKPPISIPQNVIDIHGITDERVAGQKPFAGIFRQLATMFRDSLYMIGHNLQFDKRMLEYELQRINKVTNFPWPIYNVCTVEEIQKIKGHRMSLSDLHEELFGQRFEAAHSAKADTQALLRVYKEMIKRQWTKGPQQW
jgi:DNA polymerase III epsilon subunit-like protein